MSTIPVLVGGHLPDKVHRTAQMLRGSLPRRCKVIPVICRRGRGHPSCTDCKRLMLKKALELKLSFFVGIEQNARLSLRFDPQTIIDAWEFALRRKPVLVMLSSSYLTFAMAKSTDVSSVFEFKKPVNQCSLAAVYNVSGWLHLFSVKRLHNEVWDIDDVCVQEVPVDVVLFDENMYRYRSYPAPFVRDNTPSAASPHYNSGKLARWRRFNHSVTGNCLLEFFEHWFMTILAVTTVICARVSKVVAGVCSLTWVYFYCCTFTKLYPFAPNNNF